MCTGTPKEVCTCRGGQDSCVTLNTCQPAPTPKPQQSVDPCKRCEDCVKFMQDVVSKTAKSGDKFEISDDVYESCNTYPSIQKVVCAQLRKDVRESQGGNLGKRAGQICSRMGMCDAASASCTNITSSNATVPGSLDLCTIQGVSSGASVYGPAQSGR